MFVAPADTSSTPLVPENSCTDSEIVADACAETVTDVSAAASEE